MMIDLLSDPKLWLLVLLLSTWGSLARLPNYYAGQRGKDKIETLYPRIKPETWERLLGYYEHLGPIPLLVSSIPLIGSVLTITAGMAGIGRNSFLFWVSVSKIIRNWLLVFIISGLL